MGEVQKLDDIDPPFAAFDPRDVRLATMNSVGELSLS